MFDQLGTLIKPQWEEIKAFVIQEVQDISARIDHLESEKNRYNTFVKRLQRCDHALGGTSLRGNPGASFNPSHVNEKRLNLERQNPVPASGTSNPLKTGPGEEDNGTVSGGDLVWLDKPQLKKTVKLSGSFDDASTASLVAKIKEPFIAQIRRRRENLEYRLKKILDKVDQIDREIIVLKGRGNSITAVILTLLVPANDRQARRPGLDPFAQTNGEPVDASPDGRVQNLRALIERVEQMFNAGNVILGDVSVSNQTVAPEGKPTDQEEGVATTQKKLPQQLLFRNLFRNYIPTRVFPVWPFDDPTTKFDVGDGKTKAGSGVT